MEVKSISFIFKGERNYVQGPDLFNEMMQVFMGKELSNIRFTAHEFISVPKGLIYSSIEKEELNEIKNADTRCQLNVDGITQWLAISADTKANSIEIKRQEYDEEKLIKKCNISQENVILSGDSPYTFIETIVSMNKYLLQNIFPNISGKWIFTRIDLVKFSTATTGLSLQFKHNMNFRLTKSDILVDGEKIGELYFSLVKS